VHGQGEKALDHEGSLWAREQVVSHGQSMFCHTFVCVTTVLAERYDVGTLPSPRGDPRILKTALEAA
jgi:hypothetical protein